MTEDPALVALTAGGWYRTLTPDGEIWAETSDPSDAYLAHPDPTVELTWWVLPNGYRRWQPWDSHPLGLRHPSTDDDDDDDDDDDE